MKHIHLNQLKNLLFSMAILLGVGQTLGATNVVTADSCDIVICNSRLNVSVQAGNGYPTKVEMFIEGPVCMDRTYSIFYYDINGTRLPLDTIHVGLPDVFRFEVVENKNGNSCWGNVELKKMGCNLPLACNDDVLIIVKKGESYPSEAGMFLEGKWCTDHDYTIEREDPNGGLIALDAIDENLPGAFTYVITDTDTGNKCWGRARTKIVDCSQPFNPVLISRFETHDCFRNVDPKILGFPVPDSAIVRETPAGEFTVSNWTLCEDQKLLYGDHITHFSCNDSLSARLVRTWVLYTEDQRKFESKDTFEFRHGNLDNVEFPLDHDGINQPILDCNETWNTGNNIPTPDITGSPDLNNLCEEFQATYNDQIIKVSDHRCYTNYKIIRQWVVLDWCSGKSRMMNQLIKVECSNDRQIPVAICQNGLTFKLGANGTFRLFVEDIDDGSYDDCAIASLSFAADSIVDYLDFTSADAGKTFDVVLHVNDYAGNQNRCIVEINIVGTGGSTGNLGGRFLSYNLNKININDVLPSLRLEVYNDVDGQQTPFCQLPVDPDDLSYTVCVDQTNFRGPYFVHPEHNDYRNFIKGVTTLDYVYLIRLMLAQPPYNPYILRAADINNSQSITASDASLLRAYILGQKTFDEDYWEFYTADATNPHLIEGLEIKDLPYYDADIVPVRIGDLSHTALNGLNGGNSPRSPQAVTMYINDTELQEGQLHDMYIYTDKPESAVAIQMGLYFDSLGLEVIDISNPGINSKGDWAGYSDEFRYIHVDRNLDAYKIDGGFMRVTVRALKNAKLSELVKLNVHPMMPLMIDEEFNEITINLEFRTATSTKIVGQNSPITIAPNPFNGSAAINLEAIDSDSGVFKVFDASGQLIFKIDLETLEGRQSLELDDAIIRNPGLYLGILETSKEKHIIKMIKM